MVPAAISTVVVEANASRGIKVSQVDEARAHYREFISWVSQLPASNSADNQDCVYLW